MIWAVLLIGCGAEECHDDTVNSCQISVCCAGDSCTYWTPAGTSFDCFDGIDGDCADAEYDAICAACGCDYADAS